MRDIAAELKELRLNGMAGAWAELTTADGQSSDVGIQTSRWLIEHLLQGMGCAVTLVDDGRQALDALTGANAMAFDVVFMDCQMPEIDGFEATRRFRRHEQSAPGESRLPIVAMTALAMPEDAQRCLDAGMDDYCSKPVDEALVFEKLLRYAKARELTAPA